MGMVCGNTSGKCSRNMLIALPVLISPAATYWVSLKSVSGASQMMLNSTMAKRMIRNN